MKTPGSWIGATGRALVAGALALSFCMATVGAETVPLVKDVSVRSVGAASVDTGFVLAHTTVEPDSLFDRMAVARDVRALLDTGRFTDVSAELEPIEGGVRVIYVVQAKFRLAGPVHVVGAQHVRERRIRDLLRLDMGDLVDDHTMGVRVRKVVEAYRDEFFPDAEVHWSIEPLALRAGWADVRVTIDEHEPAKVYGVRFEGNDSISARALRKAFRQPLKWNPLWLFRKKRYEEAELEAGRLMVLDTYMNAGYLDARVEAPRIVLTEAGRTLIDVAIAEGPRYRFGDVGIEGATRFPESSLQAYLTTQPGAWASMEIVRDTVQNLRDYYGSRGYVDTRVRPVFDAAPQQGIVDLAFRIDEGEVVRIRNIYIRGNTRTRDKVIRREVLVYPGEEFNEVRVRRSERRLQNLGFFETVRSYPESSRIPDQRDLVFEVEEKRTGQFMLGAGFSSVDNLIGFVELTQGNFDINGWPSFTGGGQKLKLHGEFGSRRTDYALSFVEPWFLDRKLSLGLDVYRTDVDYTEYDLERIGSAVSLTKALPYATRINFTYRFEDTSVTDVMDEDEYADIITGAPVLFVREDATKSSLRVGLTFDTRDNPFVPSRGTRATLYGRVTGGPFGFDTDVYEVGLRAKQYWPLWFGHVLSLEARYETVEAYGDTKEVPLSERLFIGGGRTIRGFDYREVGPKARLADAPPDDTYYRPYGGQTLAMASLEYTVPVVPSVRLAGFYDTGNVWLDAYEGDFGILASSVGVGIRLDMPGFPIRIDRAWSVEKDNDLTDEDDWSIWIGYDY